MASNVASNSFMLVRSIGWQVKYISPMYSLGGLFRFGASDDRIMYSLSSRCIMNGSQDRPDSIQTTGSLGNRSGRPLITQLVI